MIKQPRKTSHTLEILTSNLRHKIRAARGICLVALALCTGNVLFAQTPAVINPDGGVLTDLSDGIALYVGANSSFQMIANNKGHIYSSGSIPPFMNGDHAVALRLAGSLGTRTYGRLFNSNPAMLEVSQSGVTGTGTSGNPFKVVTTLRPDGTLTQSVDSNIRVLITDSYIYPELKFTRKLEVTGLNSADSAKLYWYFDTSVGATDSGVGYMAAGVLGAQNQTTRERLQFTYNSAFPAWSHYASSTYYLPRNQILSGSGDLSDTVNTTYHDVGLALQWNIPANSTSYTTGVDLEYLPANIGVVEKYTPSTLLVGEVSQMEISLTAVDPSASNTDFTYTLPAGYRIAATPGLINTCNPAGTISAAANSSSIVVTALPIPGASVALPYTCEITLNVVALTVGVHEPSFTSASVGRSPFNQATLTVEADVGIIKEVFSPALTLVNQTSYFTLTLENRKTQAQSGIDLAYNTYNSDLNVPSSIVSSTCGTPTINVTGTTVELGNINIPAAPSASTPSQCQITFATKGLRVNQYWMAFMGSNFGVERTLPYTPQLNVTEIVNVDARFVPALITHPATSRFEMTLTNRDKSPFTSAAGFGYNLPTNVVEIAASPNISNTCLPSGSTVTFDTITYPGYVFVNVANLSLQAASATQPYTCTIALDVQSTFASQNTALFEQQDPLIFGTYADIYTSGSTGLSLVSALSKTNILPGEATTVTMQLTSALAQSGLEINYYFDAFGQNGANIEFVSNSFATTCPSAQLAPLVSPPHPVGVGVTNIAVNANTSCQISFQITSQITGAYSNYLGPNIGSWTEVTAYQQPFYVLGGFSPPLPPQNGAVAAIPVASPYALLLTALSLLLAAGAIVHGRKMQKSR